MTDIPSHSTEFRRVAVRRFRAATVGSAIVLGLISPAISDADSPSPAVIEKARQWYLREIINADEACETARAKLVQARTTLRRVEALLNRASAGDVAGRSVALQAAATAKSAIQKKRKAGSA